MTVKSPVTGNPFKRLFRTVDGCGILRILAAVVAINHWEDPLAGLVVFIFMSALTDVTVLRPLFKKTFLNPTFTEADTAWLKEKQDISPKDLMGFFRKILTFRSTSLSLAAASIPLLWMVKGLETSLIAAPFVYVAAFFILFSFFQHKDMTVFPKKYRTRFDSERITKSESVYTSLIWSSRSMMTRYEL